MNLEEFEDAPLFKQVEGFPDYLISEYGVVWDTRQNKELKWIKNNDFNCVNMYNTGGKKELVKIHQLVAKTYLTKPEKATKIVVHKDLNRDNNHHSNLEWKIKGVSNKAFLKYSNYHGVKYHLTELEEISEKSGLPLWSVRNRLEAGYTVEEIYQGYKNSDVYWCDGLKFIGELALRKYNEDKARKEKEHLYQERLESIENARLEEVERQRIILEKRGTDDPELVREARNTWVGIMGRCYDVSVKSYKYWGGAGATVCEEWHDPDVFCGWYVKNKIKDWDMEKDILQPISGGVFKQYSPVNCCFVPKYLNQWFAHTRVIPVIQKNKTSYSMTLTMKRYDGRKKLTLTSTNIEDLKDQYFLVKDLHLERHAFWMNKEWGDIKGSNPNSPEIHPILISILKNFSTEEYLKSRNI